MNTPSPLALQNWRLPEYLFIISAAFAMGAMGFFLAIFLQLRTNPSTYASMQTIPVSDKDKVMNQAVDRGDGTAATTDLQHNQYDATDPHAPEKLKLMQQQVQR